MPLLNSHLSAALSEHESCGALKTLTILQAMAAQKTNAVLQVLLDVEQLESERRYPDAGLLFAGKRWRAFYHCHEAVSMHPAEHGHFHIFTDIGKQRWVHIAGLSIDAQGQPLQWFMVNRWVTDGELFQRENFFRQLAFFTENDAGTEIAADWLAGLIQLYAGTLLGLLEKRDAALVRHIKQGSKVDVLEDRGIYTLAMQSINLQEQLEKCLLQNNADVPPRAIETKSHVI